MRKQAIPAPVRAGTLTAIRRFLGKTLLPKKSTRWLMGLFGATAAAPIIGHEIERIRGERALNRQAAQEVLRKASAAVQRGLYAKAARLEDLKTLRETLDKARNRRTKKGPSLRFQRGLAKPQTSDHSTPTRTKPARTSGY